MLMHLFQSAVLMLNWWYRKESRGAAARNSDAGAFPDGHHKLTVDSFRLQLPTISAHRYRLSHCLSNTAERHHDPHVGVHTYSSVCGLAGKVRNERPTFYSDVTPGSLSTPTSYTWLQRTPMLSSR